MIQSSILTRILVPICCSWLQLHLDDHMHAVCHQQRSSKPQQHKNFEIPQLTEFGSKHIDFSAYFDRKFEFYVLETNS